MAIALTSLVLALAMGGLWWASVRRLWMKKTLPWLLGAAGMAIALALVAMVQGSLVERLLAGLAIPLPLVLFGLQLIAEQPDARVAVRVGDPIKEFEAFDGARDVFALRTLRGHRFLLKFYRGHW